MAIEINDVAKIAQLSQLHFDTTTQAEIQSDLEKMLDMMKNLKDVDTDAIEPLSHPIDQKLALRDDVVTEPDRRQAFQALAPEVRGHLYVVPPVIESE